MRSPNLALGKLPRGRNFGHNGHAIFYFPSHFVVPPLLSYPQFNFRSKKPLVANNIIKNFVVVNSSSFSIDDVGVGYKLQK